MTKFSHVIIRRPGKSLSNGITSAPELGQPIYERAIEEHYDYEHALEQCGVDVSVLPALEQYPDSCFVEDPAVITRCGAIITNPGADSRNGEKDEIEPAVRRFFDDEHVKHIVSPGTLDGGDVMMVGDHFYVGRSAHQRRGHPPVLRDSRGLGPRGFRGSAGGGPAPQDGRQLHRGQQHARLR